MADVLTRADGCPSCLIAALADGAGSAACGLKGAEIAVAKFVGFIRDRVTAGDEINRTLMNVAFRQAHESIRAAAEQASMPIQEFATTLIGVVSLDSHTFFGFVGDGAAVACVRSTFQTTLWPTQEEVLNSPPFLTSTDFEQHIQVRRVAGTASEIFLMTDGLQLILIDPKTERPQEAFFRTAAETLAVKEPGLSEFVCKWIAALLSSDHIVSRTHDDTSLFFSHFWSENSE